MTMLKKSLYAFAATFFVPFMLLSARLAIGQDSPQERPEWSTHAHDAQHTGVSSVPAQPLHRIRWSTPIDLNPQLVFGELLVHYGSPLVTSKNTVIVPVKTGASDGFRVDAHEGRSGFRLWTENTDYSVPAAGFTPSFGPALSKHRLVIPAGGGTVLIRQHPDERHGKVTRLVFYGKSNFEADPTTYQQSVKINTPITVDSAGNMFFGFVVLSPTPVGLESGLARLTADGTGTWISATFAANDPGITKVMHNCAPALSLDGRTVYVAVNSFDFGFGYLLALDSTTLEVKNKVLLLDPATGLPADTADESSATPTVGPDGDVFFGVLEDPFPFHNDRGWLLHFNADLTQEKLPGSFGWDDTASIVDASLVSSYHGSSNYLLMTKYNNYAGIGTGDGINRLAVLDPQSEMPDRIDGVTPVMREVLTIKGVTPDTRFRPFFPDAVREWCINTAAVDPFTKTIIANSEDGKLYRWRLSTNTLDERLTLTGGLGEAYTPTVIGVDGTVYAINDAVLFAIGE
jgi:hypothetical protein